MTAIIDYGVGNLFSLRCSFASIGEDAVVTSDRDVLLSADRIILPGVGAFGDAADKLNSTGMADVVREAAAEGMPLLGICLGMQLLYDVGFEYGEHKGLGLIKGEVRPISETIEPGLKIPHIGWNALKFTKPDCPLFKYIKDGDYVYFVHSFHAVGENTAAVTEYGGTLTAAAANGNVFGCQFHPEKSGRVGLDILRGFVSIGK